MEYETFDEKQFIVDTTRQIFKWLSRRMQRNEI